MYVCAYIYIYIYIYRSGRPRSSAGAADGWPRRGEAGMPPGRPMCMHIYIYIYVHTCICMYTYIYIYIYVGIGMCNIYNYTYICIHIYVCMYVYIYIYIYYTQIHDLLLSLTNSPYRHEPDRLHTHTTIIIPVFEHIVST